MIKRKLTDKLKKHFFKKKAIILIGPRQVGKTTLFKSIVEEINMSYVWFTGDEPNVPNIFNNITSGELIHLFGKNKIVVIDEAQQINNIGSIIKLIVDNIKDIQIIITGSSSFELANKLNEPLTGRKYEYLLYPVSFGELVEENGLIKEIQKLNTRLIYGSYPEIVTDLKNAEENLIWLSDSYLYKDILKLENIKKPSLLIKLLQALAWQVGSEVSYNELAKITSSDPKTVEKYIDLLEKSFVIFRLNALSRNSRNEIKKSRKIYFYDNGIRNAVIGNFNPVSNRNDIGQLWKNYLISERFKFLEYNKIRTNVFFWRTTQQQEIDYIEERAGYFYAYEFKFNPNKKARLSKTFQNAYPQHKFELINRENYHKFLGY
ncbi:hypothetical protein C5S36_04710 [Candidatus Methanophagaceae archaeon]|nr:hypothetical protein C5S36_04710 [Methanophagales archaeon]